MYCNTWGHWEVSMDDDEEVEIKEEAKEKNCVFFLEWKGENEQLYEQVVLKAEKKECLRGFVDVVLCCFMFVWEKREKMNEWVSEMIFGVVMKWLRFFHFKLNAYIRWFLAFDILLYVV